MYSTNQSVGQVRSKNRVCIGLTTERASSWASDRGGLLEAHVGPNDPRLQLSNRYRFFGKFGINTILVRIEDCGEDIGENP